MKKIIILVGILLALSVSFAQAQEIKPILLQGQVTDTDGNPIGDAVVEIWSTDYNGNYNHPGDSDPSELVDDFQYFGTATTDENGNYVFLTIKPGLYEPRPVHIHFKVKQNGETFTSQFYFAEDFNAADVANSGFESLFLDLVETDVNNEMQLVATGNIVLPIGTGDLTPTPAQQEGPYYPVIDFAGYDNNLLNSTTDDDPLLPVLAAKFDLLNLNTVSGDELLATIPDFGNRMVREFEEYRPYISINQFRREIGKYVDEEQVTFYEQYVYVPININESDADTLMQIPGVTSEIADTLMQARPFESNEAFLSALGEYVSSAEVELATNYLVAE